MSKTNKMSKSTKNRIINIIKKIITKNKKTNKTSLKTKSSKSTKSTKSTKKSVTTNKIILPTPTEFRISAYFDDMVDYYYKEKKIRRHNITDNDIIEYMNKLSDYQKNYMIKQIKEIKEYQLLENKINFQPLTIELIRKKYWNAKTKKWKPIKSYYADSADPNDYRFGPVNIDNIQDRNKREEIFCDEFIPNGDLEESYQYTDKTDKTDKTYKNWLQSKKLGPYKYEDYNYKNKRTYVFLEGKRKYCGDDKFLDDGGGDGMQICQGNYVSANCVGGPNWVEVDEKDYV